MQYGYAYQLGERAGGLDPDAKAYITAIETAGATVTSTQKKAINAFFKSGKSGGWYSSIKRLYLPIWASAAPNAVDMITRASGSFNGTVTHSAGYVQGDGSTGYFIFDSNMSSLGMTLEDHMLFFGNYSGPTPNTLIGHIGNRAGGTLHGISLATVSGSIRIYTANSTTNSSATLSEANTVGIIMGRRTGSNVSIRQRRGSGFSTLVNTTSTPDGSLPDIPMYSLRSNFTNNNSQVFCSGCAAGMDTNGEESFSLALKNLWETSTGLTLP